MDRYTEIVRRAVLIRGLAETASKDADRAKKSKKAWEAAVEAHQEFILEEPEVMPLFDPPASKAPKKWVDNTSDDETWREVPLAEVISSPSLIEKLEDQGFKTVGSIADWTSGGNHLTDIDGVGKVTAESIESSMDEFWAKRAALLEEMESDRDDADDYTYSDAGDASAG